MSNSCYGFSEINNTYLNVNRYIQLKDKTKDNSELSEGNVMSGYLSELQPHQAIRYLNIRNESANYQNWDSATMEGCRLFGCNVSNTSLFSTDIISTSFMDCSLSHDDFSHADICSIVAASTKFNSINFNIATMRDCEYQSCYFCNCTFEHIAMTHTKFVSCCFENIIITQSSSYLNEFHDCTFKNCHFQGNFFYSIFSNCIICSNFTPIELKGFNAFFHCNESVDILSKSSDVLSYLKENYLFLNIEIFRLNCNEINLDTFILESLIAISQLIKHNVVVRLEQIDFIQKLFVYACQMSKLSPLTMHQGISVIDMIFESPSSEYAALQKSQQCLNQLKNTMYLEYMRAMSNIPKITTIDYSSPHIILYKITYEEEPQLPISEIINQIFDKLKMHGFKAERIKTEKGSFIEYIQLLNEAEPIIQIILSLTTGAIVPIALASIKNNKKHKESSSERSQHVNIINSNINSPTIVNNYNIVLSNFEPQTQHAALCITQVLSQNNVSAANGYLGYSQGNIRSIEIITPENMK